jgi:predicted NBD/HSP70 family sugar kinase
LRAVAVSVANPVHPSTHEVIALPGSPFPEGLLSPSDVLAEVLSAPVLVDNDVNLAALAEHRVGAAGGVDSFAYVYVGAGLGLGLYVGDRLIRGAHGLAGEIGYLPGADVGDEPGLRTLAAELAAAGLGRSDAPSNDVEAVLRLLDSLPTESAQPTEQSQPTENLLPTEPGARVDATASGETGAGSGEGMRVLEVLSRAVARAIASVQAVIDPELVVLGGPVGSHPVLLEPVRRKLSTISIAPGRLEHGTLGVLAPLNGAVYLALDQARAAAISHLTSVSRS